MKHPPDWPDDMMEAAITQYGDMLYRLCLILLKNTSDAEDAVQDTFIRYFQNTQIWESDDHRKAWLIRVATNRCRDILRYHIRHLQTDADSLNFVAAESSDSGILEALAMLPEKYELVLTLYYIEEYPIKDIAKIIGRTSSAVKMRLQKGRNLLKEVYRKEFL